MLYIKDGKKRTRIAERHELLTSFFSKGIGLMFSRSRRLDGNALVFSFTTPQRVSLTMWFVFYPIDALFLDEKKRVVEMRENFRPFTNHHPKHRARYVIECKAGTARRYGIRIGSVIGWE